MAMILLGGWLLTRPVSPGLLGSTGFAITIAVLGLVSFGVGVVYIHYVWRCPACGRRFQDGDGVFLNPHSCDGCGMSFE
jgi:hypothetical protein